MKFIFKSSLNFNLMVIFFFLFTNPVFSQFEGIKYSGYLKISDSLLIPYRIEFNVKGNSLTGYSISDFKGPNETKSKLEGYINFDTDSIFIKETSVIYTKADYSTFNDFCFVNLSENFSSFNKNKKINSKFEGVFSDGVECISGSILLMTQKKIEKKIKRKLSRIDKSIVLKKTLNDSIKDLINKKLNGVKRVFIEPSNEFTELTKDQVLTFTFSDKFEIYVRDFDKVDGDVIQIKNNSYEFNSEIKLVGFNTKIQYLNSNKGFHLFEIIGKDEGAFSPITSLISINQNGVSHKIKLKLREGEKTFLKIHKI